MTIPLLAMSVAAGGLFALSQLVLKTPCWGIFFIVAAVAWPMWIGQREYALFQHRLALVATTLDTSRVRRWFWRGRVTSVLQMVSALFWAALLLAFAPPLDAWHLGLLATDVVVLAVAAGYARSLLRRDVREEHVGLLARRWLLLAFNLIFLTTSLFAIDYFLVGAPDTRGMAWDVVADRAYAEFAAAAACPLAGMVVGILNAADRLNWHAAQVLIPGLPGSGLKFAAWALFLLQAGVVAFAYTRLMLGMLAWAARREPDPPETRDGLFPTTLVVLAVAYLLGVYALRDFDPSIAGPVGRALVERVNPCRGETRSLVALKGSFGAEIESARAADQHRVATRIDQALDAMFVDVEGGVDKYLDWHFSVLGEYQRLFALVGSLSGDKVTAFINAELEKQLFANPRIGERLAQANQAIAVGGADQLSAVGMQLGARLKGAAHSRPCWTDSLDLPAIPAMEREVRNVTISIASGLVVGAATSGVMAGRLSRSVASRLVSKRAFGSAASIAGRAAGKRAGSAAVAGGTGTAACAAGGPFALVCGFVAGAITWLTVDKVLVEIDEWRFREDLRKEILQTVKEQKEELSREMRAAHGALIDETARRIQLSVNGIFLPVRDGR